MSFAWMVIFSGEGTQIPHRQSLTMLALSSVSARRQCIMFSTKNPPSVQRIPWPNIEDDLNEEYDESETKGSLSGHDTWILNDHELPWLVNPNGIVSMLSVARMLIGMIGML